MSTLADIPEGIPVPPHRYIPGKTPRHPEGWFDPIKKSVHAGTPAVELHETEAFVAGRAYFNAGYFWECHEVLEAVWLQAPDSSAERDIVQAIIQLANARLKILMGRPRAALRLCSMVETQLGRYPENAVILGLPVARLVEGVHQTRTETIENYSALNQR
ncbi:DUF309 domain-containing protein [uncultured Roseobacter sp.]|uniref:DUF309 domain-containing protein n=1 Tax=uncultured Roseobacter sp. TaxID=114847 RepID=UPI00263A299F|nr:DUF309 domain-containing protein [uncultured Roseobacter sp.]